MASNNFGSQSGDHSINSGIADFRGSDIRLGNGAGHAPLIPPEALSIVRHRVLPGCAAPIRRLNLFAAVTGTASLLGFFIAVWPFFDRFPGSSALFACSALFLLIALTLSACLAALRKSRFAHLAFGWLYLELGSLGRIHLTRFTATCPFCRSIMRLRGVGPRGGPRDDLFICERNPKHHVIELDPTILSDVDE